MGGLGQCEMVPVVWMPKVGSHSMQTVHVSYGYCVVGMFHLYLYPII